MVFSGSIEPHFHQEFALAPNTDTCGCCGFFRSKPKEYLVNSQYELEGRKKSAYRDRIESNERLCELIKLKLGKDPVIANNAFELLKTRIELQNGDKLTSDKLAKVISAIYELKAEISTDSILSQEKSKKEDTEVPSVVKKRRRKTKVASSKPSSKPSIQY